MSILKNYSIIFSIFNKLKINKLLKIKDFQVTKMLIIFLLLNISILFVNKDVNAVGVSGENFTGTFDIRVPPIAITDLHAELKEGGDLIENKIYFYVATAVDKTGNYVWDNAHSGISNEILIQTNQTHKTVRLNWSSLDISHLATTIYRSDVSDTYAYATSYKAYNCTRMGNRNNNYQSCYFPSVNNNNDYFEDNNSIPLYKKCEAYIPSVLPQNLFLTTAPPYYNFPLNFDPRTDGYPIFNFWNGTTTDKINFTDIMNWAWKYDHTEYFYWDGANFGSLGNWIISGSKELHFKEIKAHWLHIGSIDLLNSYSDSEFIMGEIQNGLGKNGVRITFIGTGDSSFNLNSPSIELYDNYLTTTPPLFTKYNGVFSSAYVQLYNAKSFLDWKGIDISYLNIRKDIPLKDIVAIGPSYVSPIYNNMSLSENIKTTGIFYPNYRHQYRVDKFISYYSSRQMYINRYDTTFIDPYSPKSNYEKWMAYPNFLSPRTGEYYQYNSLIIKVIDTDGTPLVANISIDNKYGDALDFDKITSLTKIETGSEGYFWREKIDITSATANTITDSSKSWNTNQWKGRNIMIISGDAEGEQAKIMTNTADTLTLTFDLIDTPTGGDTAGIIAEIQTVHQNYTSGQTIFNPFTITVEKENYNTYDLKFNISDSFALNRDKIILIKLGQDEETNTMETAMVLGLGIVAFLLIYIGQSVDKKEHFLLKLLFTFFSLFSLILIPSTILNGAAATADNFLKLVLWILRIFCVYIFVYFLYVWWLKSKLINIGMMKPNAEYNKNMGSS